MRRRCALQERARLLRCARHVHRARIGRRRLLVPRVRALFERSPTIAQPHEKKLQCERVTRGGTRTRNLLLRREAPYPLGHTSEVGMFNSLAEVP